MMSVAKCASVAVITAKGELSPPALSSFCTVIKLNFKKLIKKGLHGSMYATPRA